jgi:4-amino-4-deoxy-L-arabinose transferase-like glycosyltransferase
MGILLGALTSLPLYKLGSRLAGPRAGLAAALIWPVLPAISAFADSLDMPLAFFATMSLSLLLWRDDGSRILRYAYASGLVWGFGSLVSWGLFPLLPVLAGAAWVVYRPAPGRLTVQGLVVALGIATVWGMLMLLGSPSPWHLFVAGMTRHVALTGGNAGRPWAVWVWANWLEFAVFLGPALAIAAPRRCDMTGPGRN